MKLVLLLFLSFSAFAEVCEPKEAVLFQKFIPTPVGSWTIFDGDALKVFHEVSNFKHRDPRVKITKLEVHTCVANVLLETKNLTYKKEDLAIAHLRKAEERRDRIQVIYNDESPAYQLILGHSACGPEYNPQDKNLRWKVVVPDKPKTKELYEDAISYVLSTPKIMEAYKEITFLNSEEEVRAFDPNPYQVKYGAFNGYRMKIYGIQPCTAKKTIIEPKPASGKIQ
jgi:hypothetical protein